MNPEFSLQNSVCCYLCLSSVPPLHCDVCQISLCKACVADHLLDESKRHRVVPFQNRRPDNNGVISIQHHDPSLNHSTCIKHSSEQCNLYCEHCENPVCDKCIIFEEHKDHFIIPILKQFDIKQNVLQKDLKELQESLLPKYEKIASCINLQKSDLITNFKTLKINANRHGEELHKQIDIIIEKTKSDIDEMESKYLAILNEEEREIEHNVEDIRNIILDIKNIRDTNNICLVSSYKTRHAEFRILPRKLTVALPVFSPPNINTDSLYRSLGFPSGFCITIDEHDYPAEVFDDSDEPLLKPLLDEPQIICTINTEYEGVMKELRSIASCSDEEIWTCGKNDIMRLYSLQGKILKSILTESGNKPQDIAVSNGELVYTDYLVRTVNIVKNTQRKQVIRLQDWKPHGICSTTFDDLLVIMDSVDDTQSKVVRFSDCLEKQNIQYDKKGKPLYSSGGILNNKYVSENRNQDICVTDSAACAVVVVNQSGEFRFRYRGSLSKSKNSFKPFGITTDGRSRILITDFNNNSVHIIDQDGQFLRQIELWDLRGPWGLDVDSKDNLFLAEYFTGKVKKVQYYNPV